ncbi:hypothetical protein [Nonomuraea diastatica]|uniref:hypothetical protein n=1 Tax=Nonomuraea diastatica TaxID=1848329 RepID=UPI0014095C58|nr:hypothetical protein [Nonomuraea diastatica]
MDEDGSYGGRSTDPCPRCGKERDFTRPDGKLIHQVPEVLDNEKLRETAGKIIDRLKEDGSLFPKNPDKAFFMIGVLEVIIGGKSKFFASSSGYKNRELHQNWLKPGHLERVTYHKGKWEVTHPEIPNQANGWKTILGYEALIPPDVHKEIRPCAAIRLLRQVALSNTGHQPNTGRRPNTGRQPNTGHLPITGLKMAEMVFVGKDIDVANPELQRVARNWHGKMSGSSWTAHSCDGCMKSIPYLICSRATNEFIHPNERPKR